jgi:hypothetical protein
VALVPAEPRGGRADRSGGVVAGHNDGLPPKKLGAALVQLVGPELLDKAVPQKWDSLRAMPPGVLSQRVLSLVDAVQRAGLLSFDEPGIFLATYYAYHGFFNLAKATRLDYVDPASPTGKTPYALTPRQAAYGWVEGHWTKEARRGNLWVEYGVSVTNFVPLKQEIIDDWIPLWSPYWND